MSWNRKLIYRIRYVVLTFAAGQTYPVHRHQPYLSIARSKSVAPSPGQTATTFLSAVVVKIILFSFSGQRSKSLSSASKFCYRNPTKKRVSYLIGRRCPVQKASVTSHFIWMPCSQRSLHISNQYVFRPSIRSNTSWYTWSKIDVYGVCIK